jgi:hypothetical protein
LSEIERGKNESSDGRRGQRQNIFSEKNNEFLKDDRSENLFLLPNRTNLGDMLDVSVIFLNGSHIN